MDLFAKGDHKGGYKVEFDFNKTLEGTTNVRKVTLTKGFNLSRAAVNTLERHENIVTWANMVHLPENREEIIYVTKSSSSSDTWPFSDSYNVTFVNGTSVFDDMITSMIGAENFFFFATHVFDENCHHRMYHYGYYLYWFSWRIYLYEWPRNRGWVRLGKWYNIMDYNSYLIPKFILSSGIDDWTLSTTQSALIFYSDDTVALGNPLQALRLSKIPDVKHQIAIKSNHGEDAIDASIKYASTLVGG